MERLAGELRRVLATPDIRDNLTAQGFAVTAYGPDAFASLIRAESERWPPVVRAVGARLD